MHYILVYTVFMYSSCTIFSMFTSAILVTLVMSVMSVRPCVDLCALVTRVKLVAKLVVC
jgi:hypothetical protein